MNEKLKFYKGNESALPDIIPEPGSLYHCEDTGNTYLANENGELEIYSNTFTFSAAEADVTVLANADLLGGYPASDYAFIEDLKNLKPEDIGAAPTGYGLGTLGHFVNSPDEAIVGGFYTAPAPSEIASSGNMRGVVFTNSANWITQIWSMHGSIIKRELENGSWKPYEWVNPPMVIGQEYRTTKRHNGQTVYAKLLSYNPKSFTAQTVLLPHEISNFRVGLSINVMWNKDGAQWRHFPSVYYGDTAWNGHAYWHGTENICFECGSTLRQFIESSGWNVRVLLEYTKEM